MTPEDRKTEPRQPAGLVILGATGSIGSSTLDVVARHPRRYRVHALTAHVSAQPLLALCERHRPRQAVLSGCADNSMVLKGQVNQLQQQQLAVSRQNQQWQGRAGALDRDNQELATLLLPTRRLFLKALTELPRLLFPAGLLFA